MVLPTLCVPYMYVSVKDHFPVSTYLSLISYLKAAVCVAKHNAPSWSNNFARLLSILLITPIGRLRDAGAPCFLNLPASRRRWVTGNP
jgi:hypothetical protein